MRIQQRIFRSAGSNVRDGPEIQVRRCLDALRLITHSELPNRGVPTRKWARNSAIVVLGVRLPPLLLACFRSTVYTVNKATRIRGASSFEHDLQGRRVGLESRSRLKNCRPRRIHRRSTVGVHCSREGVGSKLAAGCLRILRDD